MKKFKVQDRANKKIKVGDMVRVIRGKEGQGEGKVGKVLKINKDTNRVVVEKVNMIKRHEKPSEKNRQGGISEKEGSIHLSNVMKVSSTEAPKAKATKTKTTKDKK